MAQPEGRAHQWRRPSGCRAERSSAEAGIIALALTLALAGCTQYPSGGNVRLHNDMGTQPVYRPQRDPRPLAEYAVPRGAAEPLMTADEAERQVTNPVPATPASLDRGGKLFAIYCTPCHGARGKGDGPVAAKLTTVANLTAEKYLPRKDGFFYGAIRAGSGLMPPQSENLSAADRWGVVNHLRKLQRP